MSSKYSRKSILFNGRKLKRIKCVTVGDTATGKTCLLVSYTTHQFPAKYVPTVLDNHSVNVKIDKAAVKLDLWDTAGTEEYDTIRNLSFANADVSVARFSLDNKKSYENIEKKWVPEIREHDENVPIFMLCTKVDLRDDAEVMEKLKSSNEEVTKGEAQKKAEELGIQYLECSALSQKGLKQTFDTVIRFALLYKRVKDSEDERGCVVF